VRYCTSPQVLQRITSRSRSTSTATLFPLVPFIAFEPFCSDTGAPRRLFRHADERNYDRGEGSSWRDRHNGGIRFRCQAFFSTSLNRSVKIVIPLDIFCRYAAFQIGTACRNAGACGILAEVSRRAGIYFGSFAARSAPTCQIVRFDVESLTYIL